jgi:hypothetical protein
VKAARLSLEEIMKPTIIRCAQCGGDLHIIPFKKDLGKRKFTIETINICGKCTFKKG